MKIYNKLNTSLILNKTSSYAVEKSTSNTFKLMLNAGKKIAEQICSNYKKRKTLIICGVGGNGGDGFVTANELLNKNWEIDLVIIGNKSNIKGDSLKALNKLKIIPRKFEDINLNEIELFVVDLSKKKADIHFPLSSGLTDFMARRIGLTGKDFMR